MAGGLPHVLPRARKIGAEAVQIFCSSPRRWQPPRHSAAALSEFREELWKAGLPLFVHSIYLINLASPELGLWERSIEAVVATLRFAAAVGAEGVVTHIGSARDPDPARPARRVAEALAQICTRLPASRAGATPPRLLLEGSAGGVGSLGGTLEELAVLVRCAPPALRAGACLDTAHLFAAGYPVHRQEGLEACLEELDARLGLQHLGLVHLNDCATALGARRDRHENLGEGEIGSAGLAAWVRQPRLRELSFVLETPGFSQQGPDRRNMLRAKRFRGARDGG